MPSTTSKLAEARAALVSDPVRAAVLLDEIVECLRARPEAVDRREMAALTTLARNGESFWSAWGRLAGLEPGYTSEGMLAPELHASHITVDG